MALFSPLLPREITLLLRARSKTFMLAHSRPKTVAGAALSVRSARGRAGSRNGIAAEQKSRGAWRGRWEARECSRGPAGSARQREPHGLGHRAEVGVCVTQRRKEQLDNADEDRQKALGRRSHANFGARTPTRPPKISPAPEPPLRQNLMGATTPAWRFSGAGGLAWIFLVSFPL